MADRARIDRLEKAVTSLTLTVRGSLGAKFWLKNPELRSLVEDVCQEKIVL
jgi:hypothetical protein